MILNIDGFQKARAVTQIFDDGSLGFAGNIPQGTSVSIGMGNSHEILSQYHKTLDDIEIETFFIYSCMARRRFMPNEIYKEIAPFAQIAPTTVFLLMVNFIKQIRWNY